jgi:succinyl-diaminopimelate desuccinylase
MDSRTLTLTKALVEKASITPEDKGCQDMIANILQPLGFKVEWLPFAEVKNLWARFGTEGPLFVFAGHTDVVPTGPAEKWKYLPFVPTIEDGLLYARGTADMKGSIAAMLAATEKFFQNHSNFKGSIGYLITSDEEGPSVNGTVKVVDVLENRDEKIDYCLVGEPSSSKQLGDVIKNGRRGSLNGKLTIKGKQGHVAYPDLADNPIHRVANFLKDICQIKWDEGNDFFPPTTFQVSNLNSGTGAENVVPGSLEMQFNFRYSTELSSEEIQSRVTQLLEKHHINYTLKWRLSGIPFLTAKGKLVEAAQHAIKKIVNIETELSTSGGTSDGRFIAPTGAQVLELGPLNNTIHQINECVSVEDLENLSLIYYEMLKKLFIKS